MMKELENPMVMDNLWKNYEKRTAKEEAKETWFKFMVRYNDGTVDYVDGSYHLEEVEEWLSHGLTDKDITDGVKEYFIDEE